MRLVDDPAAYELDVPKRGYTTRAKEEQRRTAAPAFTGRVRRWEKRWSRQGHLTVMRWERVDSEATDSGVAETLEEPPRKRARFTS